MTVLDDYLIASKTLSQVGAYVIIKGPQFVLSLFYDTFSKCLVLFLSHIYNLRIKMLLLLLMSMIVKKI